MATKPHPSRPHTYPNRVLIVASGESPQVITETLYALANAPQPFVPTQTWIVTTGVGRERASEALWGEQQQLAKLREAYQLPDPGLTPGTIAVPTNPETGLVFDDAHSELALDQIGNLMLRVLGEVGTDDTAIHFSLAGGRKTMSYLAGLALSLMARPQDRLSHVVLSDPRFERRDFFFPPVPPTFLEPTPQEAKAGLPRLWTGNVDVRIVDVPLLRLRELLGSSLVDPASERPLSKLVEDANVALTMPEQAVVEFDIHLGRVWCNGTEVRFPPGLLAFYYFLARRGAKGLHARASDEELIDYLDHYSHVLPGGAEMRKMNSYLDKVEQLGVKLFGGQPKDRSGNWPPTHRKVESVYGEILDSRANKFNPDFSNANKLLKKTLGALRAQPFLVQSRHGHYSLPEGMRVVWKDARHRREI